MFLKVKKEKEEQGYKALDEVLNEEDNVEVTKENKDEILEIIKKENYKIEDKVIRVYSNKKDFINEDNDLDAESFHKDIVVDYEATFQNIVNNWYCARELKDGKVVLIY